MVRRSVVVGLFFCRHAGQHDVAGSPVDRIMTIELYLGQIVTVDFISVQVKVIKY